MTTRKPTGTTPKKAAKPRRGTAAKPAAWRPKFLQELAETCNVSHAARVAGVDRRTAYDHRDTDAVFAAAWDDAVEQGVDTLEMEARRRALHGTSEPVFYQGELCGTVQKYSDTLTIFLLKAHRPDKYRDQSSVDVTSGGRSVGLIPITEAVVKRPAGTDG